MKKKLLVVLRDTWNDNELESHILDHNEIEFESRYEVVFIQTIYI